MEHSKLLPLGILKKERLTIAQIAKLVINFYKNLAVVDNDYSQINIISEKKSLLQSINVSDSNASQYLANEILHQNIDDIRKIDKVDNPDINFSRDAIISFGLEAKTYVETLITLSFSFSTKLPGIACIVVNQKCFDTFRKAKFFLETFEKSFPIEYSVIKISDQELNKVARGYKAPLGWITYFSKDYEIPIPDDLEGIEYEHTNNGKYLILTRDDITKDTETFQFNKNKLLDVMEEIKRRVPEYSK
jgi:hypothetical protein